MYPFRFEYSGRGELADRQQRLAALLNNLKKVCEEFNVAIFVTNQVMADPGGMTFVHDAKKAVGGHILAHAVDTRIMLRKGKAENRIAKIVDSPSQPEAEATFSIVMGGIRDSTE